MTNDTLHFPQINAVITFLSREISPKNSSLWHDNIEYIRNLVEEIVFKDDDSLPVLDKFFATQLSGVKGIKEGSYNSDKDEILYKLVTQKASKQTKEALSRMKVGALDTNPSTFALTCRYSGDFSDLRLPIRAIFNYMSPEILVAHDFYGKDIISSFYLGKNEMNQDSLTRLFSKADKAFMTNKNDCGLVLASMMSSVLNHVSKLKTDSGENMFPDEVIDGYKKEHKDMFVAGDIINKFTPPKTTGQVFLLGTQPSVNRRDDDFNFKFM